MFSDWGGSTFITFTIKNTFAEEGWIKADRIPVPEHSQQPWSAFYKHVTHSTFMGENPMLHAQSS
jgi:hypothetical protein